MQTSLLDKRLVLQAIRRPDGSTTSTPEEKYSALAEFWSTTFAHKPANVNLAEAFAAAAVKPMISEMLTHHANQISSHTRVHGLRRLVDQMGFLLQRGTLLVSKGLQRFLASATGSCWGSPRRPTSRSASRCTSQWATNRRISPMDVSERLTRHGQSDSRIAIAKSCVPSSTTSSGQATSGWAHPAQRGFVAGRRLLQNVVDIDSAARIHGSEGTQNDKPALAFFDIAAAFPIVAHSWIYTVMRCMKLPSGIQSLIRGIYTGCTAVSDMGGVLKSF
jgi:hypothetical protein